MKEFVKRKKMKNDSPDEILQEILKSERRWKALGLKGRKPNEPSLQSPGENDGYLSTVDRSQHWNGEPMFDADKDGKL